MLLLLLLMPCLCFGVNDFAEPDPSQVLTVYNSSSTLDTDNDGTYDYLQIIDKLHEIRGYSINLLGINCEITYNNEDQSQSNHIDWLHYDFDVSSPYGASAGQDVVSPKQYILQTIAAWYDADSANRWVEVPYIELVEGLPTKIRGNDAMPFFMHLGYLGGASPYDSTIYRSLACYLWEYLAPGAENNGFFTGKRISRRVNVNPYYTQVKNTGNWLFTPGTLKSYASQFASPADTFRMWIALPTLLDGNNVQDVLDMLDRSETQIIQAVGTSDEDYWAVVDEAWGNSGYAPYSYSGNLGFDDSLGLAFPSRILADVNTVVDSADVEDVYIGWTGDTTLGAGDSCAFYFTAASKHDPRPSESGIWFSKIGFPIAPGAICWTPESYNGWTVRDTSLRPSGEGTQTLMCDAIHEGFTYAIGNSLEPLGAGMPSPQIIASGIRIPHLPFALLATASVGSFYGSLGSFMAVGPAIGYFRQALTPATETITLGGNCNEAAIYAATMPSGTDSILFGQVKLNGDTVWTRVNTSSGGSVNQTISTRWNSPALSELKLIRTIVDSVNVHHTEILVP